MSIEMEFLVQLAVATGVGGLIGLEREQSGDHKNVVAGVRTFPIVSISGLLVALLEREVGGGFVLGLGVAGAFGLALLYLSMRTVVGKVGLTTAAALILTFLLGAMIAYGFLFEVVVIGVLATFLLLTKDRLHGFAEYLDDAEMMSALQFITVLFILLPVTAALPPAVLGLAWLGRGALVDPYVILLVVVFVSSISFASLLVMRRMGPTRGIAFSGLLGGLVNSEATTAGLAERAKAHPGLVAGAVVGAILTTVTMIARNLAIAGFAAPRLTLMWHMVPYLLPMALVAVVLGWRMRSPAHDDVPPLRVKNPFAIMPALRFALLFGGISIATQLATDAFGEAAVYASSLGGLVSAGAVVASVATLYAGGTVPLDVAMRTGVLATVASVAVKLLILRAGHAAVYERARGPFAVLTVAGLGAVLISFFV